jgi:DNA-binding NarL/FixJ family response regulator
MPFIEMGKDIRTLTAFALKYPENSIPRRWLETINRKSASYAKHRAHVITKYKHTHCIKGGIFISQRESEILTDLSHGLSRADIATSRNLSINTVKMVINNLYIKLGAENLADAIRIATEQKMI